MDSWKVDFNIESLRDTISYIYACIPVHLSFPFPHASNLLCILALVFPTGSIIVLIVVTNVLESDATGNAWRMNGIQDELVRLFDCLF